MQGENDVDPTPSSPVATRPGPRRLSLLEESAWERLLQHLNDSVDAVIERSGASSASSAPAAQAASGPPRERPDASPAAASAKEDSAEEQLRHAARAADNALAALQSAGGTAQLTAADVRDLFALAGRLSRSITGLGAALVQELLVRPPSTEHGPLHKQLGYPSPRALTEHLLGLSTANAHGLVEIAEATAPRHGVSTGALPPAYPLLALALSSGEVSADQARTITQTLPRDHRHLDPSDLAAAEASLVGAATAGVHGTMPRDVAEHLATPPRGHEASTAEDADLVTPVASGRGSLDAYRLRPTALRDQARLWAAFLDPDGPEPQSRKHQAARALNLTQLPNGMWRISGLAPAVEGAALKTLLDAMTAPQRDNAHAPSSAQDGPSGAAPSSEGSGEAPSLPDAALPGQARTAPQRRFDALAAIVAHYAGSPEAPRSAGAAPTLLILTSAAAFAAVAADGVSAGDAPAAQPPGPWAAGADSPAGRHCAADRDAGSPSGGQGRSERRRAAAGRGPATPESPPGTGPAEVDPAELDPFDPWAFAGVGWDPPSASGRECPPPPTAEPDGVDPFDPWAFAGAGWDRPPVGQRGNPPTLSAAEPDGVDPFDPWAFAGRGWDRPPTAGRGHPPTDAGPDDRHPSGAEAPATGRSDTPPVSPDGRVDATVDGALRPVEPPDHADPFEALLTRYAVLPHTQQVVSLTQVAHLVCSANLQFLERDEQGHPLRLGRAQRLFTAHQRKALAARDRHCRAPGCSLPAAFCDAHHLRPWHLGGDTDLENALLLCSFHHHLAHQEHGG